MLQIEDRHLNRKTNTPLEISGMSSRDPKGKWSDRTFQLRRQHSSHDAGQRGYKCTIEELVDNFIKMQARKVQRSTPQLTRIIRPIQSRNKSNMSLLFPRSSSLAPIRHEIGPFFNLWNDTFSELQRLSDNLPSQAGFAPKFDVKETKEAYTLEGELPGIEQKDVTIEFTDEQTLTIKGRTEHRREEGHRPEDVKEADAGQASESNEVAQTGTKDVAKAGNQPQHTYWVSERNVGSFQRSFSFPQPVSQDAKASLKDGILSVVIPKVEKQNMTRRINIE